MKKTSILIVGIGGVGGYFGGLLAKHYENTDVEIAFLARGPHLEHVQTNGLKVIKGETEFIARPALATNNPHEAGSFDYILICVKNFDLHSTIEQIKPCVNSNTVILPLLNGVDGAARIRELLPHTVVLDGIVYIVSRLKQAGIVENSGNIQTLYFGPAMDERTSALENIFKDAGIEATLSDKILSFVWEKFIFISSVATATSYLDQCLGKVLEEHQDLILKLINEVHALAKAKQIDVDPDIVSKTLEKQKKLPYQTTSSMHSDFQNKKRNTELESLTGYVVDQAELLGIEVPTYKTAYEHLKNIDHHA